LSREKDEIDIDFKFDMQVYSYQAVMLFKLDNNLASLRDKLVPDLVSDEDFWRNYFFEIEKILELNNQPTSLGARVHVPSPIS
jgi:hypothetical protein